MRLVLALILLVIAQASAAAGLHKAERATIMAHLGLCTQAVQGGQVGVLQGFRAKAGRMPNAYREFQRSVSQDGQFLVHLGRFLRDGNGAMKCGFYRRADRGSLAGVTVADVKDMLRDQPAITLAGVRFDRAKQFNSGFDAGLLSACIGNRWMLLFATHANITGEGDGLLSYGLRPPVFEDARC